MNKDFDRVVNNYFESLQETKQHAETRREKAFIENIGVKMIYEIRMFNKEKHEKQSEIKTSLAEACMYAQKAEKLYPWCICEIHAYEETKIITRDFWSMP